MPTDCDAFMMGYLCNQAWEVATGKPLVGAGGHPNEVAALPVVIADALQAVIAAADECPHYEQPDAGKGKV